MPAVRRIEGLSAWGLKAGRLVTTSKGASAPSGSALTAALAEKKPTVVAPGGGGCLKSPTSFEYVLWLGELGADSGAGRFG